MEMFLQFGYGMMEHCRHLTHRWGGSTVVLSPRDLTGDQLTRLSADLLDIEGGRVLLDPQFYLPRSDHHRLQSHGYWPSSYQTGSFFQGVALRDLLQRLLSLNDNLGAKEMILPGLLADRVEDLWLENQRTTIDTANSIIPGERSLFATVALSADVVRDQEQIEGILDQVDEWSVGGVYLVCEHPNGDYLVQDPLWLANLLDLVAGFKLAGLKVVIGYCTHQFLIAGTVKADAICSGTWMNVRSFPPEKFRNPYDDEIKQRAVWYYCPQALSEYKIPFLDVANEQGALDSMSPPESVDGGYVSPLFEAPQPSSVRFSERRAFRHYLYALKGQVQQCDVSAYDAAKESHESLMAIAESLLARLRRKGVRGQLRDFGDSVDAHRAALELLDSRRGPMLRRHWADL